MMSSPLNFEQLARLRRETYEREAAADRLARQVGSISRAARPPLSVALRVRLATWLYALAARLSSGTADAARTLDAGCQAICCSEVEYWPSA